MKRALLLLSLLGAGLLLGAWTSPRSSKNEVSLPEDRSSKAKRSPRSGSRPTNPSASIDRSELDRIAALPRGSTKSVEVVELAYRIPMHEIASWLHGDRMRALSWAHGALMREILQERWLADDPAAFTRYMVSRGPVWVSKMIGYLDAWCAVDREGAFRFVRSLRGDDAGRNVANALIAAVAKSDAGAALALYQEFRDAGTWVAPQIYTLVRTDRAILREWIRQLPDPAVRSRSYAQAAQFALSEDFSWAIETLQESGIDWRGLTAIYLPSSNQQINNLGQVFLEHIGEIPSEWIPEIANIKGTLSSGNELEWLQLRQHSDLAPDHLAAIQHRAAEWPHWKIGHRRPEVMDLVENGAWLTEATRIGLRDRVLKEWRNDPQAARTWLATLPPELQQGVENRFETP